MWTRVQFDSPKKNFSPRNKNKEIDRTKEYFEEMSPNDGSDGGHEMGSTVSQPFVVMQYLLIGLVFLFYFVVIVVKLCRSRDSIHK